MPRDLTALSAEQRHRAGSIEGGHASAATRRREQAEGMAFARGWRAGFDAARRIIEQGDR